MNCQLDGRWGRRVGFGGVTVSMSMVVLPIGFVGRIRCGARERPMAAGHVISGALPLVGGGGAAFLCVLTQLRRAR